MEVVNILKLGNPSDTRLRDLVDAGPVRAVGEYGVVGVVGVGASFPALGRLVEGVSEVVAGDLGGEVEDGGRPTPDGGAGDGSGARSLRLPGAADVGVGFDASGDDYLAGGVYDASVSRGNRTWFGDCRDTLAGDGDVEDADSGGSDDLAAGDEDVGHGGHGVHVHQIERG